MSRKIYNDYLPEIERVVPTQEELIASGYKFSAKNEEMEKRRAYYEANKARISSTKTEEV